MSTPVLQRLLARIAIDDSGCWEWCGYRDPHGYGRISVADHKAVLAHRVSYAKLVGAIPVGLDLDHLCRNRACCNPDHLEPVSRQENLRRGVRGNYWGERTHCVHGHEFNELNTYIGANGVRHCKPCRRVNSRKLRERRRVQGVAL